MIAISNFEEQSVREMIKHSREAFGKHRITRNEKKVRIGDEVYGRGCLIITGRYSYDSETLIFQWRIRDFIESMIAFGCSDDEIVEAARKYLVSPDQKELNGLIGRCLSFAHGFVNKRNELILVPSKNYFFRLEDVKTDADIKCKLIEWISQKAAENHWNAYWSPRIVKFLDSVFGKNFGKREWTEVYIKLGNGIDHDLCVRFVESGLDMKLLEEST